ncbi:flagellar basal body rod protein FlgB [Oricola sp.]|uniref:flagellar basal body rod protein FlgB n=1 Tax=Oricola sp. TaxID=1979950 RepID=UPI003BAAE095
MEAVNLFHLATTQAKWLSLRQTAVANNIANAHMPAYTSVDVQPFEEVLSGASVRLGATSGDHFGVSTGGAPVTGGLTSSGQSVSVESELVKSAEIKHSFEMNTAIVSAFHRMILMSAKSS